jgi:hypothetical protein
MNYLEQRMDQAFFQKVLDLIDSIEGDGQQLKPLHYKFLEQISVIELLVIDHPNNITLKYNHGMMVNCSMGLYLASMC